MNSPLAIVGASARAAAHSALRAGFQPVTADLFADADLRAIATATRISPYPEGLLDWIRTIEPPGWMYTGALENHPELVDQMAWIAPLWGNPGDVLARVRSPIELARALHGVGRHFPETVASSSGLPRDGTWLAKSYHGASGSGVRVLVDEYGAGGSEPATSQTSLSFTPPTFFQRRIAGIPAAAVFVAAGHTATVLGVTRQLIGEPWLGAHGFQYAGSIGPLPVPHAAHWAIEKIGQVLAAEFELVGLFGVDFIWDGDDVWVVEVNPRYTASVEIIERATGLRALEFHAAASNDSPMPDSTIPASDASAMSHGKAILFARRDLSVSQEFANWSLMEAERVPWPTLADISPGGTLIEAGRPVLTLFAEGATPGDVERQLRHRVAEIESRLYA